MTKEQTIGGIIVMISSFFLGIGSCILWATRDFWRRSGIR